MTTTSDAIRAFGSARYALDDQIEAEILEPLRHDRNRSATVAALIEDGTAQRLIRGMHGDTAAAFAQIIGGSCDTTGAQAFRRTLRESKPGLIWMFDLSHELHTNYRRMGITRLAPAGSTVMPLTPTDPSAAFSGAAATGRSPRRVPVPLADQFRMLRDDPGTTRRYSNPVGDLAEYLDGLTQEQRRRQGEILTQLPIVSGVPYSYSALPSRMAVLEDAARRYNLHPRLIAAFLLAEARDQSQLEDGKDYAAAVSLMRANTSIGLGQVVVSTARNDDLFSDLLSSQFRSNLSHQQIAYLLASDEFNIFAVAKYMRKTADAGARINLASMPNTLHWYPNLEPRSYTANSQTWPADNIAALASEYTSRPWDDGVSAGWGWFVYEAYIDLGGGGARGESGAAIEERRRRLREMRDERGRLR